MHRGSLGFGRNRLKTTSIFYQQSFIIFFFHKLFPNLHQIDIRVPTNEKSIQNQTKKQNRENDFNSTTYALAEETECFV